MNQTENNNASNSNKAITYVAIAIGAFFLLGMIGQFGKLMSHAASVDKKVAGVATTNTEPTTSINDKDAYEQVLNNAASELNKKCPFMVDKETRLDNAITMNENEFQYNYTLINTLHGNLNVQAAEKLIRPTLLNLIKTNPNLKTFRDNKTTLSYHYSDMNGVFLFSIRFTAEDYLN